MILGSNIKKLTDKVQSLERMTNETKKHIHTETEEFKAEPTTPLHNETEEEQPKIIRKQTLTHPTTIKEWPPDVSQPQTYAQLNRVPVEMLDLDRFMEAAFLFGMCSPFMN